MDVFYRHHTIHIWFNRLIMTFLSLLICSFNVCFIPHCLEEILKLIEHSIYFLLRVSGNLGEFVKLLLGSVSKES